MENDGIVSDVGNWNDNVGFARAVVKSVSPALIKSNNNFLYALWPGVTVDDRRNVLFVLLVFFVAANMIVRET